MLLLLRAPASNPPPKSCVLAFITGNASNGDQEEGVLTTRLKQETQNVAADERFRQPALLDNRMCLAIRQEDYPSKDHVN